MVDDTIYRQAAIDALGDIHPLDYNAQAYKARIEKLPSAQPERKTGEWLVNVIRGNRVDEDRKTCSICGKTFRNLEIANYCPNCGSMMAEVE